MHVISQKQIWEARENYPEASTALLKWYNVIKQERFQNFSVLKHFFNSVDKVGANYIFNIGGNKLRLIANIDFNRQKIYIRQILKHKDYEKNNWKSKTWYVHESNSSPSYQALELRCSAA